MKSYQPSDANKFTYTRAKLDFAHNQIASQRFVTFTAAIEKKYADHQSRKHPISQLISYKNGYGALNLVDADIFEIDDVSKLNPSIHLLFGPGPISTLYLSNNLLNNLIGIEQNLFCNLSKLSLSNNSIKRIGELKVLSQLPCLTALNLTGNPVTRMPYYRQEVLLICISLKSLDGQNLTSPVDFLIAQTTIYKFRERKKAFITAEIKQFVLSNWQLRLPLLLEIQSRFQMHQTSSCFSPRIVLSGGLLNWMEIMNGEYFDEIVQNFLFNHNLQRLKRSQSSSFGSDKSDGEGGDDGRSVASVARTAIERWDHILDQFSEMQARRLLAAEERVARLVADNQKVSIAVSRTAHCDSDSGSSRDPSPSIRDTVSKGRKSKYQALVVKHVNTLPETLSNEFGQIKAAPSIVRTSLDKENWTLDSASVTSRVSNVSNSRSRTAEVDSQLLQERMALLKLRQAERQQEIQERYTELLQSHLLTHDKKKSVVDPRGRSKQKLVPVTLTDRATNHISDGEGKFPDRKNAASNEVLSESPRTTPQSRNDSETYSRFHPSSRSFSSSILPAQQLEPEEEEPIVLEAKIETPEIDSFEMYVARFAKLSEQIPGEVFSTSSDEKKFLEDWVSVGEEVAGFLTSFKSHFTDYMTTSAENLNIRRIAAPAAQSQQQSSMRELKLEVQKAIQEHTLLQRQEFVGREINKSLLDSLRDSQNKCYAMFACFHEDEIDDSLKTKSALLATVRRLRSAISSIRSDVQNCEKDGSLSHARLLVSSYESLEREVAASKASLEQAEQRLQTSDSKLAEAQSVQERLWKSNTEVKLALNDIHRYIQSSSDLKHLLIVFAKIMKSATMDLESASLMSRSLAKKTFDRLVNYAHWSSRLKRIKAQLALKAIKRSLHIYFSTWHCLFRLENICSSFLERKKLRARKYFYSVWKRMIVHKRLFRLFVDRKERSKVSRALKDWKCFAIRSSIGAMKSKQEDLCVRLFLSLKAFRGWKVIMTQEMASAQRRFLHAWSRCSYWLTVRTWKAWRHAYDGTLAMLPVAQIDANKRTAVMSQRRQLLTSLHSLLVHSRLRLCWRQWSALYRFRLLLCLYRAKKRSLVLWTKAFRESLERRVQNAQRIHFAVEWRKNRRLKQLPRFLDLLRRRRRKGLVREQRSQAALTLRKKKFLFLKWLKVFLVRVGQNVSKYKESIPMALRAGQRGLDAIPGPFSRRGVSATARIRADVPRSVVAPNARRQSGGGGGLDAGKDGRGVVARSERPTLRLMQWRHLNRHGSGSLETLAEKIKFFSARNLQRRIFNFFLGEFLLSQLLQLRSYNALFDKNSKIEQNSERNVTRSLLISDASLSIFEYPIIESTKLKTLNANILSFLRERFSTRNGLSSVKALQSEEDRTSLLREESDGLQTRLAALDLRTREAEVTKSDLQSSVNALNHSIAVLRRQVEKLASEKEAFREKQRLLAYFQQRDESSSSGDSKAAAATPVPEESLSHLRNMEDLYRSAWRDLSLTEGQADETDESIAARREQLGALRVQLQLRDIEGEKMKQQTAIFQQQAQDLASAVEEALRTMTSQAKDCDEQISALDSECALLEKEQEEFLQREQQLRASLQQQQQQQQQLRHHLGGAADDQTTSLLSLRLLSSTKAAAAAIAEAEAQPPQLESSLSEILVDSHPLDPSRLPFSSDTSHSKSYLAPELTSWNRSDDDLTSRIQQVTARIRDRLGSTV